MRVTIWEWRLTRENAAGSPWLFSVLPEPPKAGGTLLSVLPPDSPQPTQATASPPSPFSRPKQSGQIYICGIWTKIFWNLNKTFILSSLGEPSKAPPVPLHLSGAGSKVFTVLQKKSKRFQVNYPIENLEGCEGYFAFAQRLKLSPTALIMGPSLCRLPYYVTFYP